MENKYYDGTKLLSMLDLEGNKPEIYICTSNRSAGKTTYFGRLFINRFKKYGEKFMLIYRFSYELDDCADKFFKDIGSLFFPESKMTGRKRYQGKYYELFLDEESCGYAVSLNDADSIKKLSHLFSDVRRMMLDEFQSETNHYCPNEVKKFISIHTSVARGQSEQCRYVPVFMLSNPVTLLNPYYVELGISNRLHADTKFLKGNGFVLEQGFVETASRAQQESGFNKAFSSNKYVAYSAQNVYLNDNVAFIEKPYGRSRYLMTLKYNGDEYAIREYSDAGIVYCDSSADSSFPVKITVTTEDHSINYVMLKKNDILLQGLRFYFEHGCFRFKNLMCREVVLSALSY